MSVSSTEFKPLLPVNQRVSCLEKCCVDFCGTCHTGAGCGFITSVISAVVGAIFLGFFIWSVRQGNDSTRTIALGVGLAASVVGLIIGRCQVFRHTATITLNSPYTGQSLQTISYAGIGLAEDIQRENGREVGLKLAKKFILL